jgi:hypothetical protein
MLLEKREAGATPIIDAVACLGTPFLVGTRRGRLARGLLLGALGPLVAGYVIWRYPTALLHDVTRWLDAERGVRSAVVGIVAAILVASIAVGLRVSKELVPGSGISESVARKMLILRSCGDEAGATLSVSYMLILAISRLSRIAAWPIQVASEWVATHIAGRRPGEKALARAGAFLGCSVLALVAGGFGLEWMETKEPRLLVVGLASLILGLLSLLRAIQIAVGWAIAIGQTSLSVCVQLAGEVAFGALLLPFGPELLVATPYVMVSSEVVPPVENGGQIGAIHQLGVSTGAGIGLHHSVYDEPRAVELLADWICSMHRATGRHSSLLPPAGALPDPGAARVA